MITCTDNKNEFMNTIKVSHDCNFHSVSVPFQKVYPTLDSHEKVSVLPDKQAYTNQSLRD